MKLDEIRKIHLARLAMAEKGLTARQIAEAEGISMSSVCHWAKRHNIELVRAPVGKPGVSWRECLDKGMTASQAAKVLGRTLSAAQRWAKDAGLQWAKDKPGPKKKRPHPIDDKPEGYADGLTDEQRADLDVLLAHAYPLGKARAMVMRPRVRVPLMVPRTLAAQIRAEGRL